MIKILAIGNSFSQDATHYLHQIGEADNIELKVVNLYIGGCIIPCGDIVQRLRKKEPFLYGHGGMSICRDGFHMNVIYGRYLLSAAWHKVLIGNSITNNDYIPYTKLAPNAVCDEQVLKVIKETLDEMI